MHTTKKANCNKGSFMLSHNPALQALARVIFNVTIDSIFYKKSLWLGPSDALMIVT